MPFFLYLLTMSEHFKLGYVVAESTVHDYNQNKGMGRDDGFRYLLV